MAVTTTEMVSIIEAAKSKKENDPMEDVNIGKLSENLENVIEKWNDLSSTSDEWLKTNTNNNNSKPYNVGSYVLANV